MLPVRQFYYLKSFILDPEYKFVSSNNVARPFRTKGAIGICFRLLQTSCIFIGCHLTRKFFYNVIFSLKHTIKKFLPKYIVTHLNNV